MRRRHQLHGTTFYRWGLEDSNAAQDINPHGPKHRLIVLHRVAIGVASLALGLTGCDSEESMFPGPDGKTWANAQVIVGRIERY